MAGSRNPNPNPNPNPGGPPAPPPPPFTTMGFLTPTTTVTVDTTLVRTTLLTTTKKGQRTRSRARPTFSSTESHSTFTQASSGTGRTSIPPTSSARSSPIAPSSTRSSVVQHSPTTGAAAKTAAHSNLSTTRKHAIIGGLSSAIAGLVFVGVILALFLRKRQRRKAEREGGNEKWPPQTMSGIWSGMMNDNAASMPTPPMSRQSSTANVNGSVIRVSLGGFARPFAHHQSWRESIGLGRLMVMNPDDASDTHTPGQRESVESGTSYFQRQFKRSSLSAISLARTLSRASSRTPTQDHAPPPVPSISIMPAVLSGGSTYPPSAPSFTSYESTPSTRTCQQGEPEDPFLTPPDERLEEDATLSPPPRMQRPGLAVLQSAAGSATRTLSNLSQALNPFQSKSNTIAGGADDGTVSRQSTLTFSSNGDPFRLDRRSVTDSGSVWADRSPRTAPPVHIPYDRMYEGT